MSDTPVMPQPLSTEEILKLEERASKLYRDNGQLVPYSIVLTRLVEKAHNIKGAE